MDNRSLKKQIFEKCKETQLERIRHLELVMGEAQDIANEYGQQSDDFDSHREELIANRDMYAQQLEGEMELLETLYKVNTGIANETVGFGSVVITDLQKVFISIGLGKLVVDDTTYYAISMKGPFFLAMKGLKKGDGFNFMEKPVKIIDVF